MSVWGFSLTPAGCPAVQLNSDTIHPETAPEHTGEGLSPIRLSPAPPSDASPEARLSPVLLNHRL